MSLNGTTLTPLGSPTPNRKANTLKAMQNFQGRWGWIAS